jgi:hypothetical protein
MSKGDSEALDCPILDDGAFNQVLANRRRLRSEAGETVSHTIGPAMHENS